MESVFSWREGNLTERNGRWFFSVIQSEKFQRCLSPDWRQLTLFTNLKSMLIVGWLSIEQLMAIEILFHHVYTLTIGYNVKHPYQQEGLLRGFCCSACIGDCKRDIVLPSSFTPPMRKSHDSSPIKLGQSLVTRLGHIITPLTSVYLIILCA